jgi:hypothetical protein
MRWMHSRYAKIVLAFDCRGAYSVSNLSETRRDMTKDEAVDSLVHSGQANLAETCYELHKDQYGVKGRHLMDKSVPELVSWILTHYEWNSEKSRWESKEPLD